MLRPVVEIEIGDVRIYWADKLKIDKTWDAIAQKAEFQIPHKVRDRDGKIRTIFGADEKLINYGDDIIIKLGYYPELFEEFRGKITGINPEFPTHIEAEDEISYYLRREPVNELFEDTTITQLMENISPVAYSVNLSNDPKLGDVRIRDATVYETLKELVRPQYGIYAFVRDGELKLGTPYPSAQDPALEYRWGVNITRDSLTWQEKQDLKWKVKAISPQADSDEELTVEVGDDTGTVRTFYRYNVDKATLKQAAEEYLERVKFTGFSGSFTSFGFPRVQHGDRVNIQHRLPGRSGSYNVKRVVIKFGRNGYRRDIFPDVLAE